MKCSQKMIEMALQDQLNDASRRRLQEHLGQCETCQRNLEQSTADPSWWLDASRFLDASVLSDPQSDVDDSSACGARLFEHDDPVGELRAIGAIDPPSHPEMLGKLGRYTIEREIGSGGMGVVLKAHDAELSRIVAIKVLAPHLARSGAARQRFVREGRAAAAVVHDNIVAIHEVDTSEKLPTLVMRYVDGISLQRHIDLYGPLPVGDALRIASQTASGLAAAHRQGIIHRDVKPANILVNHSCNRAWISDFGLARAVDDASLTRTGFIAGTPHYMSPEQARGGDVGATSDLFSLGAVLYFMFAARPPWRAERSLAVLHRIVQHEHRPLWKVNPDVPRKVSDLVDRLLSKRISDRPQSAADVQAELERALSELQNPAMLQSKDPEMDRPGRTPLWNKPWFVAPATAMVMTAAMWAFGVDFSRARHKTPVAEMAIESNAKTPDVSGSRNTESWSIPTKPGSSNRTFGAGFTPVPSADPMTTPRQSLADSPAARSPNREFTPAPIPSGATFAPASTPAKTSSTPAPPVFQPPPVFQAPSAYQAPQVVIVEQTYDAQSQEIRQAFREVEAMLRDAENRTGIVNQKLATPTTNQTF